jgi:hypothetical protein
VRTGAAHPVGAGQRLRGRRGGQGRWIWQEACHSRDSGGNVNTALDPKELATISFAGSGAAVVAAPASSTCRRHPGEAIATVSAHTAPRVGDIAAKDTSEHV